jgi:hypothetical protein
MIQQSLLLSANERPPVFPHTGGLTRKSTEGALRLCKEVHT